MPDFKDIKNIEETKKEVVALAQNLTETLNKYLGPKTEVELKSCPVCAGEFDPVEIGIEEKNIENYWEQYGDKNFKDLNEQLMVRIFTIIQKIEIKPRDTETEIGKKLQELAVVIQGLRQITKIMSSFKAVYQKIKDDETAIKTMFAALSDIDKVLASIYSKGDKP